MTDELKECPFCPDGGYPRGMTHVDEGDGSKWYDYVECTKCGAKTGKHKSRESAANAWNTRYKRTCHVSGDWFPVSQTQWRRIDACSNCGYGFGVSERDNFPFEIERIAELPNFCPQCGFKVCGAEVVDG